jgi:threonine 3-dehydrogenase
MPKGVVLITGSNGEIGHSLIDRIEGLTPLPAICAAKCLASLHGQHHGPLPARPDRGAPRDRDRVPPRRAALDARRARPRAGPPGQRGGHAAPAARRAEPVGPARPRRCASSSRARSPSTACRPRARSARGPHPREHWNVPITMYGCNKLYCEHLGRYFTHYFRQLGALVERRAPRLPQRCASRASSPPRRCRPAARATSAPRCCTPPRRASRTRASWARTRASPSWPCPTRSRLVWAARRDRERAHATPSTTSAASARRPPRSPRASAGVPQAPTVTYAPDAVRAKIVDSWPEDVDDARRAADWGWRPSTTSRAPSTSTSCRASVRVTSRPNPMERALPWPPPRRALPTLDRVVERHDEGARFGDLRSGGAPTQRPRRGQLATKPRARPGQAPTCVAGAMRLCTESCRKRGVPRAKPRQPRG